MLGKRDVRDRRLRGAVAVIWGALVLMPAVVAIAGEPPLPVVVSIAPQAWLVEEIGGERVAVTTLIESGTSPATFQPSDFQVSQMMRSAVYFRIGVPSEQGSWFEAIRSSRRVEIVDLREGVEMRFLPRHHHGAGGDPNRGMTDPARFGIAHQGRDTMGEDPHTWLSPVRLKIQAATVAATLARLDPSYAGEYRGRLKRFEESLDELDRELRQRLDPLVGTSFFVFHPAWGYFAADYGLRQLALEIEGKSPTEGDMTALQKLARREGAQVIFVQPQIRGSAATAVAEAIGGRTQILDPLAADVRTNLRQAAGHIARQTEAP